MFGETTKITDGSGQNFNVEISTPTWARLRLELWKNGNFRTWRPSLWGGDWNAKDSNSIRYSSGEVWYRRSSNDIQSGFVEADVQHLDIFLYKGGEVGEDDWGIALRSFFTLNGMNSSGGSGYLDQSWITQSKSGKIGWDIPGRYISR